MSLPHYFAPFCNFNFVRSLLALPLPLPCYYILSMSDVVSTQCAVVDTLTLLHVCMCCYQQVQESESMLQRKTLGRHRDEYTLDDSEKRAVKRPKLMGTNQLQTESTKTPNRNKVGLVNECGTINIYGPFPFVWVSTVYLRVYLMLFDSTCRSLHSTSTWELNLTVNMIWWHGMLLPQSALSIHFPMWLKKRQVWKMTEMRKRTWMLHNHNR